MNITTATAARSKDSNILTLIGQPRLEPYRSTFKTATDAQLLGAYQWSEAVSASLHPLLGLVEVILRNAIHTSLSQQYSGGQSQSFAWYDRAQANSIALKGKSLAKIEELLCDGKPALRKKVQPTPDLVVSRLSFGFWPNVLEELNHRYAPKTFTEVFSGHPHSKPAHWSITGNKSGVILRLKRIQDLRNRISHFEAIWKPHWLGLHSSQWSDCATGLVALHDSVTELLGWCAPDAATHYKKSFGCNWFRTICTTRSVLNFMNAGGTEAFL